MRELFVFAVGFALLAAASVEAQQTPRTCGQRDAIVKQLAEAYGESRQSIGLRSDNAVMEVFASEETGTWTITVTMPSGMMCLVASGRAFETLEETLGPAGQPT
ncbi:hypothetical protein DLJ49_11555 [Rhodovulum sp. 12E13]|uniref:hypothetical protein n=1 Tax=Rhodovulum sp. 12E13 TaxID=2203891 RepID=UPI000E1A735A|nr:hypothetical protein [Rhodovulum sp. 12E13]RDC72265.1 hypothetical protein DLJ49_11555 [Rhodovulum sp. 12E13]